MDDFLSRLVLQIKSFLSGDRNFGCIPEEPRPAEKAGDPSSNRPESANPVEKDGSLR
jgi:hypothetical protein